MKKTPPPPNQLFPPGWSTDSHLVLNQTKAKHYRKWTLKQNLWTSKIILWDNSFKNCWKQCITVSESQRSKDPPTFSTVWLKCVVFLIIQFLFLQYTSYELEVSSSPPFCLFFFKQKGFVSPYTL